MLLHELQQLSLATVILELAPDILRADAAGVAFCFSDSSGEDLSAEGALPRQNFPLVQVTCYQRPVVSAKLHSSVPKKTAVIKGTYHCTRITSGGPTTGGNADGVPNPRQFGEWHNLTHRMRQPLARLFASAVQLDNPLFSRPWHAVACWAVFFFTRERWEASAACGSVRY